MSNIDSKNKSSLAARQIASLASNQEQFISMLLEQQIWINNEVTDEFEDSNSKKINPYVIDNINKNDNNNCDNNRSYLQRYIFPVLIPAIHDLLSSLQMQIDENTPLSVSLLNNFDEGRDKSIAIAASAAAACAGAKASADATVDVITSPNLTNNANNNLLSPFRDIKSGMLLKGHKDNDNSTTFGQAPTHTSYLRRLRFNFMNNNNNNILKYISRQNVPLLEHDKHFEISNKIIEDSKEIINNNKTTASSCSGAIKADTKSALSAATAANIVNMLLDTIDGKKKHIDSNYNANYGCTGRSHPVQWLAQRLMRRNNINYKYKNISSSAPKIRPQVSIRSDKESENIGDNLAEGSNDKNIIISKTHPFCAIQKGFIVKQKQI